MNLCERDSLLKMSINKEKKNHFIFHIFTAMARKNHVYHTKDNKFCCLGTCILVLGMLYLTLKRYLV